MMYRCFHLRILYNRHVVIVADSKLKVSILTFAVLILITETLMIYFSCFLVLEDSKHLMSAVRICNYMGVLFIKLLSLAL